MFYHGVKNDSRDTLAASLRNVSFIDIVLLL